MEKINFNLLWLNCIKSHWSHFWDGTYFPYSLNSILNIYKWRKNMEYKENQGALFTCLAQNWIPQQIAHNHTTHQIVFVWLALKCLTHYKKFTKSSVHLEQLKPNKKTCTLLPKAYLVKMVNTTDKKICSYGLSVQVR